MNHRTAFFFVAMFLLCFGWVAHPVARARSSAALSPQAVAPPRFALGGNAAEIPAKFVGNIVFLPGRVNQSRPSFFVLDSIAATSSIDPRRAQDIGLTNIESPTINLTGVDVPLPAISKTEREEFAHRVGQPYEGTLGADFLSRVVVAIDYQRRNVLLYDPKSYQYTGHGTALPLTFASGIAVIQAQFSVPKGKTLQARYAINTAVDAPIVIADQYAESHRMFSPHFLTKSSFDPQLDPEKGIALGRLKDFEMGAFSIEDSLAAFTQSMLPAGKEPHMAGEIGAGMLQHFVVIFDYPHQRLILEPSARFADEDEEDKSGISVIAKGPALKTFEIVQVQPGTPGAEGEIQVGDIIAGIDSDAAADLTLADVRDLFRQIGHKYTLLIDRHGQMKTITIQMRRSL